MRCAPHVTEPSDLPPGSPPQVMGSINGGSVNGGSVNGGSVNGGMVLGARGRRGLLGEEAVTFSREIMGGCEGTARFLR